MQQAHGVMRCSKHKERCCAASTRRDGVQQAHGVMRCSTHTGEMRCSRNTETDENKVMAGSAERPKPHQGSSRLQSSR